MHPHRDRLALSELFPESQSSAAVGSRASSPHYSCSGRLLELSYQRHALGATALRFCQPTNGPAANSPFECLQGARRGRMLDGLYCAVSDG